MKYFSFISLAMLSLSACLQTPYLAADVLLNDGFEDGDSNGWATSGNVAVIASTAIGTYSLRHKGIASSVLPVSTVGFSAVSITMNLAATSLEGSSPNRVGSLA
jgi:hypothetical protein